MERLQESLKIWLTSNFKFILAAVFNYPGASFENTDNWIRPALGFCQAGALKGQKHSGNYKFCRLCLK